LENERQKLQGFDFGSFEMEQFGKLMKQSMKLQADMSRSMPAYVNLLKQAQAERQKILLMQEKQSVV
jgi:hypothetical protein